MCFLWEDGPLAFLGQCWEKGVALSSVPPLKNTAAGRVLGVGQGLPLTFAKLHQAVWPVAARVSARPAKR